MRISTLLYYLLLLLFAASCKQDKQTGTTGGYFPEMSDRVSVSNEGWQTTDTTILRHQLNLADSIFYRYPDSARNLLIRSGTNSARIRYTIGLVRAYSLLGKY